MKKIRVYRSQSAIMIFALLFSILGHSLLIAQEVKKVGTSAATFLRIPVGARGISMGSAYVSIADDPSAMFWNPGGIARVDNYSLLVDHSPWLPGLQFIHFAVVLPFQNAGSVGINVTALTTDEMDITTPDQPMGTGEKFTASSIAIGIAYGRNLTESFSIGGAVKYVNERILNSRAIGVGFDVGSIYNTPFAGIRLGFSISNFGTKMQMNGDDLNLRVDISPEQQGNNQSVVGRLKTDKFDMPLIMQVGLSWDPIKTEKARLTVAVDGVNPNDNSQNVNLGAEVALFRETLMLRGGFNELFLEEREKGLTLGAEVSTKIQGGVGFSAGYAFQDFQHLGGVNRFTVSLTF